MFYERSCGRCIDKVLRKVLCKDASRSDLLKDLAKQLNQRVFVSLKPKRMPLINSLFQNQFSRI